MSSSIKQIYASMQIEDNYIKLILAEYFNTRFNVLKVERATTSAISDFKVTDKDQLIKDIKSLIENTSNKIGSTIERVVLVLPAYNFKRTALKSKVIPETGYVTKKDIARAISNSLKSEVDYDVMVVNAMPVKYTINGLSTRRIPEKEACDELIVDIDLLCADKEMCIDYVSCVEAAGLKVLDITLNTYSVGKEATLFEESQKQNVICLNIGRQCTYLSLFNKGRLVSTEIMFDGINTIAEIIKSKYAIAYEDIIKLIKYDVNAESKYLDDTVYAYNVGPNTISISQKDLNDLCLPCINEFGEKLVMMCKPILEQGALIFITGEGEQISSLINSIKIASNSEIKTYYPETIGVREPSLSALFGSLYAYRDKVILNNLNVNCIDLLKYDSLIEQKQFDTEGETITTKIKNLFKQYVEREDEEQ